MDLYPMALSVAGGKAGNVEPVSLETRESVLFQNKLGRSTWGLRLDPWKLVRDIDSGDTQLFRLASDPLESTDLGATELETVARLTAIMEQRIIELRRRAAQIQAGFDAPESILDPEQEQRLRALGYLE